MVRIRYLYYLGFLVSRLSSGRWPRSQISVSPNTHRITSAAAVGRPRKKGRCWLNVSSQMNMCGAAHTDTSVQPTISPVGSTNRSHSGCLLPRILPFPAGSCLHSRFWESHKAKARSHHEPSTNPPPKIIDTMCRAVEQNASVYGHTGKPQGGQDVPQDVRIPDPQPMKLPDTPNERLVTVLRARKSASNSMPT